MSTMRTTFKETFQAAIRDLGEFAGAQRAQIPQLDELWPDGTTDGEANRFWGTFEKNLATVTNDDWDLRALADGPGGATVDLREVRAILLYTDTDLTLQPGAANGWTALGASASIKVPAGSWFRLICPTDGKLPTGAADKVLRVANNTAGTAVYSLVLIGTSA